jgi:RNA polymerase sigma-32 factor
MTAKTTPSKAKKPSKKAVAKSEQVVKSVVAEIVSDDHEVIDVPTEIDDATTPLDAATEDSYLPAEVSAPGSSSQLPATNKNLLTMYLNEVRKYPVLSKEEEQKVAKKFYDTKDPAAGELLVKSNLRFVVKVAAEYSKFSNRMIDLIQEGNVGLMHAVKEFNPYKGNRLITYAVWWIRGYMQEFLMRQFSMVRIGTTANQRKLFYQLQKQKAELEQMSSPERILELSHQLGIPEDEITEMVKRISSRDVSIDKPVGDEDSGVSLGSLLRKDDGSLALDDKLALDEQIDLLKEAIERVRPDLSEKELIILEERILNDEPLTLQEIGEKYKISREAVRQNEVRLINKIKAELKI